LEDHYGPVVKIFVLYLQHLPAATTIVIVRITAIAIIPLLYIISTAILSLIKQASIVGSARMMLARLIFD
jgi:hypothetical protein